VIVGKTLRNRYRIAQQIGSGGFGITYLAEDEDLPGKPKCVVKHFKPRNLDLAVLPVAKSLFDQEATVLYKLGQEHDQIPQLFAHFEEDGEFYLVQEFIDGHNLASEIFKGKQLSEREVFNLLFNILEVLAVVHQHGVIHRDIKPPNLMRRYRDGKIVLIDFGAVKEISTLAVDALGQTTVTGVVGSSGYMPDEQANGKPKLCSDVYAVGMIGIQALTGISPSQLSEDAETGEIIWRDRTKVSDSLANVLNTMVKPHFSQRYRSADEALQGLLMAVATALPPLPALVAPMPVSLPTSSPEKVSPPSNPPKMQLSVPSDLLIADNLASSDSSTGEIAVPSDLPIEMSLPAQLPQVSSLIDIATVIAEQKKPSMLSLPVIVKASISKLLSQPIILGIGGLGVAIVAIFVGLNFFKFFLPYRPEIVATKSPLPAIANPPKTPPIFLPKPQRGQVSLHNGSVIYDGDLVSGKPHGKGKVTAAKYYCIGDFLNGELNGSGFCNYTNGDRYEGEFRNDKFNGKGKIKYANGSRYEGEFRDDNLNGKGVFVQANGNRITAIWKDGKQIAD
jgi:serine/threonine protein kinase